MVQDQPLVLDRLVPLLAAGLKDFVEGLALHTAHGDATPGDLCPLHLP